MNELTVLKKNPRTIHSDRLIPLPRTYVNYLLVFFVMVMEVTIFFNAVELPIPRGFRMLTLMVLVAFFLIRGHTINIRFVMLIAIVMLLILIQGVMFGFSVVTMITYPLFNFAIPYFLYKIVGKEIFRYLVNVIFYTGLIATIIWTFQVLIPQVDNLLQSLRNTTGLPFIAGTEDHNRVSIALIYTITHWSVEFFGIEILRNSGLYGEPGAFAYFLILAIGLNTIIERQFFNRKNILMSIMVLSTFSTAGYLSFIVLISYAVFSSNLHTTVKVAIVPLFILASIVSLTQLEFMGDKIVGQYERQIDDESVFESRTGRVRRVRSAVYLLSTSPIIGRGIISASADFELGSPYYFTGAGIWRTLSSYGILFAPVIFLIYMLGISKTCQQYHFNKTVVVFFFIAIAIGATSQRFFLDNITTLLFIHGLVHINDSMKNN